MPFFLFSQINDSFVLLHKGGRYKEAPLFERDGYLYAKDGAWWVKLKTSGVTSVPKLFWTNLTLSVGRQVALDYGYMGWTNEPVSTRKSRRKAA